MNFTVIFKELFRLLRNNSHISQCPCSDSTVVKTSPHHPKVEGLSPATSVVTGSEIIEKKRFWLKIIFFTFSSILTTVLGEGKKKERKKARDPN